MNFYLSWFSKLSLSEGEKTPNQEHHMLHLVIGHLSSYEILVNHHHLFFIEYEHWALLLLLLLFFLLCDVYVCFLLLLPLFTITIFCCAQIFVSVDYRIFFLSLSRYIYIVIVDHNFLSCLPSLTNHYQR